MSPFFLQRHLSRIVEPGTTPRAGRQRSRAQRQLRSVAKKVAKRTRKRALQRRLTPECLAQLDGFVRESRQLAALLER